MPKKGYKMSEEHKHKLCNQSNRYMKPVYKHIVWSIPINFWYYLDNDNNFVPLVISINRWSLTKDEKEVITIMQAKKIRTKLEIPVNKLKKIKKLGKGKHKDNYLEAKMEMQGFIASLLSQQREKLVKKLEKMKVPPPTDDYVDGVNNAGNKIFL